MKVLSEAVTFKLRSEAGESRPLSEVGKCIPGRRNSKCRVLETGKDVIFKPEEAGRAAAARRRGAARAARGKEFALHGAARPAR